ncbi:hypothetical protein DFH06DRAFT_1148111 [Mycena polygramma]|nr:hypothetical protein DFH06DRAFT_1148111 [Mycena polygramma]
MNVPRGVERQLRGKFCAPATRHAIALLEQLYTYNVMQKKCQPALVLNAPTVDGESNPISAVNCRPPFNGVAACPGHHRGQRMASIFYCVYGYLSPCLMRVQNITETTEKNFWNRHSNTDEESNPNSAINCRATGSMVSRGVPNTLGFEPCSGESRRSSALMVSHRWGVEPRLRRKYTDTGPPRYPVVSRTLSVMDVSFVPRGTHFPRRTLKDEVKPIE